jgi:hypothetical protein
MMLPTVNRNRRPGDVVRVLARQERDHRRDVLLRIADPARGVHRSGLLPEAGKLAAECRGGAYKPNYLVRGNEFNREDDSIDFDVVSEFVFVDREALLVSLQLISVEAIVKRRTFSIGRGTGFM